MIFYGLIGIPMNGIVMVTMGEYFSKSVNIKFYQSELVGISLL